MGERLLFYLFSFYASNFELHDWDRVTYLVYTGLRYGYNFLVLTRFRLLVGIRGILVDLYPREKGGSECTG